ncbi:MAG: hypothetical protein LAO03_01025 [Acidobacteriia bacterium]|nr:hypothetical protein [Terriglobia bacterium]
MFTQRHFPVFPTIVAFAVLAVLCCGSAQAQQLGGPLPNLDPQEAKWYTAGQKMFFRLWGVKEGLGPVTTDGGCVRCHKSPVIGGGAARLSTYFGLTNPDGSFDQSYLGGPFLQPFGTVVPPSCTIPGEIIPAGATVEKRLTSPLFGFGLIDAIADADILNQVTFELNNYQADGIHGMANMELDYHSPPLLRPGRFGRKAQQPTLLQQVSSNFAHDLGITNPLVPLPDCSQGNCSINANCMLPPDPNSRNTTSNGPGILDLSHYERFLAPPPPPIPGQPGQAIFTSVGCIECHLPSYHTPTQVFFDIDLKGTQFGPSPSLSNQPVNLYSDLLLHDMGKLNAGAFPANTLITAQATQQMWRTTPLWGTSVRTVFWHDGKTKDIPSAILQHSPDGTGEAAAVIGRYKALSPSDQAALIAFVASL